jgi:hypothetical protein
MPTILRIGPYRFFFYAGDRDETAHVHVEKGDDLAKFWLDPVRLQYSQGFNRQELNRILRLVQENAAFMLRKWDEYFSD